jgi:hypothetical protein
MRILELKLIVYGSVVSIINSIRLAVDRWDQISVWLALNHHVPQPPPHAFAAASKRAKEIKKKGNIVINKKINTPENNAEHSAIISINEISAMAL